MSTNVNASVQKDLSQYKGVFVLGEQKDGQLLPVTFELIARGRSLADDLGSKLSCILLGDEIQDMEQVFHRGADRILHVKDAALKNFLPKSYQNAIVKLIEEEKPEIVIAAATTTGRTVMPLAAAKVNTGLTADCTSLTIDPETKLLLQTRPAIGGNIMATIKTPQHRPQMATVRPRSCKPLALDCTRTGEIVVKKYDGATFITPEKFLEFIKDTTQTVGIEDAEIIVSGGKGFKNAEGFKLVEQLAELLGAGVGASRDAVELGFTTYPHQIGLSGKTVAPKLYIALGLAGKIAHLAGMQTSEVIVAVNKDPEAQIFKVADFAIVGDVFEVVPMMIEAIKQHKANAKSEAACAR
ncbi:MAG: electron transfer flavoprotein subunit alpha/FixB family protein [Veillonellales bacterium]